MAGFAFAAGIQRDFSRQRRETREMARPGAQCVRGAGEFRRRDRGRSARARLAAARATSLLERRNDFRACALGSHAIIEKRNVRYRCRDRKTLSFEQNKLKNSIDAPCGFCDTFSFRWWTAFLSGKSRF